MSKELKFEVMEGSTHAERVEFAEQWLRDAAERGEKYAGEKIPTYERCAQFRKLVREIAKQCNPNYKPPTSAEIAAKKLLKRLTADREEAERIVRNALTIPVRLHRDLYGWFDDDDDDREIDTRHLIPDWLKEVLAETKGLAAKIEAHLPRDEDGDVTAPEATEEQIVDIMKAVTAKNDRDAARRKAKEAYDDMVEAKIEEWKAANPGEHYPGESRYIDCVDDDGEPDQQYIGPDWKAAHKLHEKLGIKPFHFAGDPVYDDDDEDIAA